MLFEPFKPESVSQTLKRKHVKEYTNFENYCGIFYLFAIYLYSSLSRNLNKNDKRANSSSRNQIRKDGFREVNQMSVGKGRDESESQR